MKAMKNTTAFEGLHKSGARDFGNDWLRANQQVVEMCMAYDIDYVKHKHALTHIAFRILSINKAKE